MAQISFDALVAKRAQREASKTLAGVIPVPGTGDTLLCRKPSESKMLEIYAGFQAAQDAADLLPVVDKALYYCCPDLQNPKLHQDIGIKDPLDVVPALFEIPERDKMGGDLFRFLGLLPPLEHEDEAPFEAENPAKN